VSHLAARGGAAIAGLALIGLVFAVPTAGSEPASAIATPAASPAGTAPAASEPFTFRTGDELVRQVAAGKRSYEASSLPSMAIGDEMDASGVMHKRVNGALYDHPTRQATAALSMLDGYRLTGDPAYLERARNNANHLLVTAVHFGEALFFPFPFDFSVHADPAATLKAPWFSALSQGMALSAFVRLFEATNEQKWRTAAEATFVSFRTPGPVTGRPWVVYIDPEGYLWLEEYPGGPVPDRTFNGHIIAIFGLHDYWQLTNDAEALRLIKGALTTLRGYEQSWRVPGGISRYCMAHPVQSAKYHVVHIDQLVDLYTMTGDPSWAQFADLFIADYPDPAIGGVVSFGAGAHIGYRLDAAGRLVARRMTNLRRASRAHASARRTIVGASGVWLAIKDGSLAGYLVRETREQTYLRGIVNPITWEPPRTLALPVGPWTAYRFSPDGQPVESLERGLTTDSEVRVSQGAIIQGHLHYLVADGPWAGYWIPAAANQALH
jgi:hypothetical protein